MKADYYTDDVHGVVIGGDDTAVCYRFYTTVPPGIPHYLGEGWFECDADAEAHARAAYPDAYRRGIEMRAYDCPDCAIREESES